MKYLRNSGSNYEKKPIHPISNDSTQAWRGWDSILNHLESIIENHSSSKTVVVCECYSGVFEEEIEKAFSKKFSQGAIFKSDRGWHTPQEIDRIMKPDLGGEDPIFGFMTRLTIDDLMDASRIEKIRDQIDQEHSSVIFILGPGASRIMKGDLFIYADMPRWEGQLRQRRNEVSNWGVENKTLKASLQYKRSFFIDWRVGDRLKRETMNKWDFFLDTTVPNDPRMMTGTVLRTGLHAMTRRPFRLVPFFDPGPWGGQWMKEVCNLPDGPPNYAWCFDCVPEENSLLLQVGEIVFEIPSINLVFAEPQALLGEAVYGRFGAEFPIRFDFLDTMEGGNLSFQVHPPVDFARESFGLPYTQDESYYILDALPGAEVYLGCRKGILPEEMIHDLERAQRGEKLFDDGKYAARFPAKKHDHFLIPAGTLHCSGSNSMVLEISATPYIFTYKLWDWNRLGLDGLPRPVNIERAKKVIQWNRDEDYARDHLINQFQPIASGEGWREEKTGLHPAEFIETRRHWFTKPVLHPRTQSVEVLNLVEGSAAVIESPECLFAPFEVHYAETFVLPLEAGDYRIRPLIDGESCATLKAYVKTSGS